MRTTRIACRPGCPARTPAPRNVEFFDDFPAAARAGYRACKRCAPDDVAADAERARLVARACALLDAAEPPRAGRSGAARSGLSRFHFQRVFRAVTGLTPGAYLRARRDERFRAGLAGGASVTAAIQRRRLRFVERRLRRRAARHDAFGLPRRRARRADRVRQRRLLARARAGRDDRARRLRDRARRRRRRRVRRARAALPARRAKPRRRRARAPRCATSSRSSTTRARTPALELDVRGTAFQRKVWDALRSVKPGAPVSTPRWPAASVRRARRKPSARPAPPTGWRSRSPATAWCARTAGWPATAGASSASARCWRASATRGAARVRVPHRGSAPSAGTRRPLRAANDMRIALDDGITLAPLAAADAAEFAAAAAADRERLARWFVWAKDQPVRRTSARTSRPCASGAPTARARSSRSASAARSPARSACTA